MLAKKKRWRWCLVQIFSWLPMGPEHKEERLSALFFLLSWYSLLLFRTKPHFSEGRDIMVLLQSVINHQRQKYLTLVYLHESLQQQYLLSKIQKDNFFWRKFVLYLCRTNASFFLSRTCQGKWSVHTWLENHLHCITCQGNWKSNTRLENENNQETTKMLFCQT